MFKSEFKYHGFGVGLRHKHFPEFRSGRAQSVDWVEVISENYLAWDDGAYRRPVSTLLTIRKNFPVALHGTSLSIGSSDPLDLTYLKKLKELIQKVEPICVSDHLCWTGVHGQTTHDLLPLPYTEEAIQWVSDRVARVQDFLGQKILLENVSSYVEFANPEMSEGEFLSAVASRADCGILLDVNNIYVSAFNHRFPAEDYLKHIPKERVGQIHLAGHTNKGTHLIDTHSDFVCDPVWELYREVARTFPPVNTMIEWDDDIPEWDVLAAEVGKARKIWQEATKKDVYAASQRNSESVSEASL